MRFFRRKPSVLFFPVNGSGLGHLTRCLAYARRLPKHFRVSFFSLSPAIAAIEEMGFAADYFVSPFWSDNSAENWNAELAMRLGLMLENARPDVLVFDGTYPFKGLRQALRAYGRKIRLVWSRRGLLKPEARKAPVKESFFDLVICPGEIGISEMAREELEQGHCKITVPPVALQDNGELLSREAARERLNLPRQGKIVLLSPGPGNLKNVDELGKRLGGKFQELGCWIVCLQPPISIHPLAIEQARPLSLYPVAPYLRAFDFIASAAGYNTCCEIAQSGVPGLLIPNECVMDDQKKRAALMREKYPVRVCGNPDFLEQDIEELMNLDSQGQNGFVNGAGLAARAIEELAE